MIDIMVRAGEWITFPVHFYHEVWNVSLITLSITNEVVNMYILSDIRIPSLKDLD